MTGNVDLSLVVPVYYEQECIAKFIEETKAVCDNMEISYEYVFVDDGSLDDTCSIIKSFARDNKQIKLIELSYNQGKAVAVTTGITHARGKFLLYMDPDLQDPPAEIPNLYRKIKEGYDIVYGVRKSKEDTFINKIYSKIFWSVLNRFTGLNIPKGLAVMRVFNRKFANKFLEYGEQNRFIEGIFIHIGMKSTTLEVEQQARYAGRSKFNFRRKLKLAFDAIFDFSEIPLKITIRAGIVLIFLSILSLLTILLLSLFFIDFQLGWPSIISAIVLGLGVQLTFLGIIAKYVGKIYKETKKRPLFSIKDKTNIDE